jgi:hypothetical protein
MGRGSRITARSALAALGVMALAAFLGTTEPGHTAPVSGIGEQGANAGAAVTTARLSSAVVDDKPCVISAVDDGCDSTYPYLVVDTTNPATPRAAPSRGRCTGVMVRRKLSPGTVGPRMSPDFSRPFTTTMSPGKQRSTTSTGTPNRSPASAAE